jgi:UPF0042 nucleotide-binding protein
MGTPELKNLRLVVITGLSGSGKSTVIRVLEDMGFFCVDNLPIALLPKLIELRSASLGEYSRVALVMDLREKEFLKTYPEVFRQLREKGYPLEILFLEASDEVLVRRYSQTRRTHPLAEGCGVWEGIQKERQMLAEQKPKGRRMNLTFLSFGYSRGIPQEADLVIDVRFLPNPYFEEELKTLSGTDPRIGDYLFQFEETKDFVARFHSFLAYLLPLYEREGKAYLTVAVGCTGGRHRSVAIAEKLGNLFHEQFPVRRRHRDLEISL